MTLTINLEPAIEERLKEQARQQGRSVVEYLNQLIVDGVSARSGNICTPEADETFLLSPRMASGMKEAKERIRKLMDSDPAFAAAMKPTTGQALPEENEVLEDAYDRTVADSVFEERYGRELADLIRANIAE